MAPCGRCAAGRRGEGAPPRAAGGPRESAAALRGRGTQSAWWPKIAHWPAHGSQGGAALFKVTGRHISHGGGEEKERTNAILFF